MKIEFLRFAEQIDKITTEEFSRPEAYERRSLESIIEDLLKEVPEPLQTRFRYELNGAGPLEELLQTGEFTEIAVNAPDEIWVEKNGVLERLEDTFFSEATYKNFIHRLVVESGITNNLEHPVTDGVWRSLRFCLVSECLTEKYHCVSFRKHPESAWSLRRLVESNWCTEEEAVFLRDLVHRRQNLIVCGPTSSGKTSILNALLGETKRNERTLIIEDTRELQQPNGSSVRLLTRPEGQGELRAVTQRDLVRASLRLRPDRIVIGEVRGDEAVDLLLALATGHSGSMGSLHASTPAQALYRLEMLVQMGSPAWPIEAIRRLISTSVNYLIFSRRTPEGQRQFDGCYKVCSAESFGITYEKVI
ncbi:MAG: ATPase, T2SS/T4P/T4SS family [Bdellovibrionaceae bacterium]|nr:ATPase, T2SS/T4P/T4SS family [Pseudobdellovibrionaceae bacterium]